MPKSPASKAWEAANSERVRATARAWYVANRERKLAYAKAWREANPEQKRAAGRAWYEANKERQSKTAKAWDEAHPGVKSSAVKAWHIANPGGGRKHAATRRAHIVDTFVESVDPIVVFDRDGGVCQICVLPIGNAKWHVDHRIPLSKGGEHSYANCQLAHARCNMQKGAKIV